MGVPFSKIPTDDPTLRSLQENIAAMARAIPTAEPVVATVTSDYQVTGTEDVIHVDAQAAPVKITLRSPSSSSRPVTIKQVNLQGSKSTPHPVTIVSADGSKTIAGFAKYSLDSTGTGSVSLTSDDAQHWPTAGAGGNPAVSPTPGSKGPPGPAGKDGPPGPPGPGTPPFLYHVQYASPDGDNAADGSLNFPKKTRAAAFLALLDGGDLYATSNTEWSDGTEGFGLTAGQGMWLTGFYSQWISPPPGWLPDKAFNLHGWGLDTPQQFGMNYALFLGGSSSPSADRTFPAVWIVGSLQAKFFRDFYISCNQPYRVGWDYIRNTSDASIKWNTITTATRVGTSTTLTLSLPAGYPVVNMARAAGLVTAKMNNIDLPPVCPLFGDLQFVLQNGTVAFPGGNYVLAANATPSGPAQTQVQYLDDATSALSGSDSVVASTKTFTITEFDFTGQVGAKITISGATNPGNNGTFTVTSVTSAHVVVCSGAAGLVNETFSGGVHCTLRYPDVSATPTTGPALSLHFTYFQAGLPPDFIEFRSTDTHFKVGMYEVIGTTATTITVLDNWGPVTGGNVTVATPGTCVLQERLVNGVQFDDWTNCGGDTHFGERYNCGPTFDRGSTAGFPGWWHSGSLSGTVWDGGGPHSQGNLDPNSMSSYFGAGGIRGGTTINVTNDTRLQDGNIRCYGGAQGNVGVKVIGAIQDTGLGFVGVALRPTVEVVRAGVRLYVENCQNADDPGPGYGLSLQSSFGTMTVIDTKVENTGIYTQVGGSDVNHVPSSMGASLAASELWNEVQVSGDAVPFAGVWGADGRLAGKRADLASSWGVIQNPGGLTNLAPDPSAWTLDSGAVTVTPGQSTDRLVGDSKAFHITGAGVLKFVATTPSSAAGDHIVFGAWYRTASPPLNALNPLIEMGFVASNEVANTYAPFGTDGCWDYVTLIGSVPPASAGQTVLTVRFPVAADYVVYAPFLYYLPIASVSLSEANRIGQQGRFLPLYLQAGMAGTQAGVKLIAHGGVGVDSTVLATPSGTASPTKNLPLLDASGAVQGYVPVIPTNSNLPAGAGTVTSVGATAPITSSGGATPNIGVNDFVASGASHARGTVPDPGGSAGTAKFLREDATWDVPAYPTTLPPNGAAGGDLAGTYPNPTVIAFHESGGGLRPFGNFAAPGTAAVWDGTHVAGYLPLGDLGNDYTAPTVLAIHETSGPAKLTIGAVPDSAPDSTVLIRPAGSPTIVGIASSLVNQRTKRDYLLQAAVAANITDAGMAAGGNGFLAGVGFVEYPNEFIAGHIQLTAYMPVNSITSGTLSFEATLNGTPISGTQFSFTSGTSPGEAVISVQPTGSASSSDTIGFGFSTSAGYTGGFQNITFHIVLSP